MCLRLGKKKTCKVLVECLDLFFEVGIPFHWWMN